MLCLAFGSVLLLGVVVLPRFYHVVAFLGGPALLGPLLAAELLPMLRSALRGVVLAAFVMGLVTFGLGLLNVPGIVMSIIMGALLIAVIALPRLWSMARRV